MNNVTRVGRFMFDTKTQAEWEKLNTVLLKGELVLEYDTKLMKIGDGVTKYNRLPYANRGKDGVGVTPEQQEMLEQFDVLLEKSVNKEYLNDKLALYVKEVDISDYISRKADLTYVDEKLLNKADLTYVDEKLLNKADITYVDEKLLNKADITYVDEKLLNKADITYVDEKLLNKADTTDLDNFENKMNEKVNKSDIVVIKNGEEEPQLSEGQILIVCEV